MIRSFVAAPLPAVLTRRLAAGAERARAGLAAGRWAPADRFHLTLRFLGDLEPATASRVGQRLEELASHAPVAVRPAGSGGFPAPSAATILWAGLAGEGLAQLAAACAGLAAACGAPGPDRRPFVPHITIARFRRPCDIRALDLWGGSGDTDEGVCLISRVVLLESRLSPAGPSYTALTDVRLAGGEHAGP